MKYDPTLAHSVLIRSLEAKLEKLEARVRALESRRKPGKTQPRTVRQPDPATVSIARPIIDRAARMHGCSADEICGSRGARRVIRARAQAAYECGQAGLSSVQTGLAIGGRDHTTILNLHKRHKERLGIE
jgi:chromosomal replication initiation ATPase DnaA